VSYVVLVTATARRDLVGIPPRIVSAIIEFLYGDLAGAPERVGKPLQRQLTGTDSARRGPYRILYEIDQDTCVLTVLRIGHRADIYRPGSR